MLSRFIIAFEAIFISIDILACFLKTSKPFTYYSYLIQP